MANPRKFAEKIALHTQKQEEGTRAFEQIMKEVSILETTRKPQHQQMQPQYLGGSLPNVNISLAHAQRRLDLQTALDSLDRLTGIHSVGDRMPMGHKQRFAGGRTQFNANNRFRGIDTSPYHVGCHLSPPQDQGWRERRIASDSALHDSVVRAEVKPKEKTLPSYEVRKVRSPQSRPKSCEVPGMTYPADHMSQTGPNLPIATANTGGSLPDLTNLNIIPSPLQTPIDTDEHVNQALSPTQLQMSQRQSPIRRQPGNPQQMRKPQYTDQIPLMDANLRPLESRLQQYQLYPQGNIANNDFSSHGNSAITTSASPTLSPTSSAPMTPLFGSLPTSPLSTFNPEFYFKQQQQQQSNTQALQQQQLEQFPMHRPMAVGGMLNSSMQLPFQTLLAQTPATIPGQGMPSLAHFYGPGHSRVPDLIVTGIDDDGVKSDFAKDLSTAMGHIGGDDPGDMYSPDDPFQKVVLDPLDVEGFQMLSGQDSELTDAATEDQFRLDRLGATRLH